MKEMSETAAGCGSSDLECPLISSQYVQPQCKLSSLAIQSEAGYRVSIALMKSSSSSLFRTEMSFKISLKNYDKCFKDH